MNYRYIIPITFCVSGIGGYLLAANWQPFGTKDSNRAPTPVLKRVSVPRQLSPSTTDASKKKQLDSATQIRNWLDGNHTVQNREELDDLVRQVSQTGGANIIKQLNSIPHLYLRAHLQSLALAVLVSRKELTFEQFMKGPNFESI